MAHDTKTWLAGPWRERFAYPFCMTRAVVQYICYWSLFLTTEGILSGSLCCVSTHHRLHLFRSPCLALFPDPYLSVISKLPFTDTGSGGEPRAGAHRGSVSRHLPSKLPWSVACCSKRLCVSREGWKTNTPLLKQSGQPGSGAAENSPRSKRSSILDSTCGSRTPGTCTNTPLTPGDASEKSRRDQPGHVQRLETGTQFFA